MKVKSESEDTQSCPTLSDPMDCSLPGSSIHGIFQARVLEWVAIAFSESVDRGYENLRESIRTWGKSEMTFLTWSETFVEGPSHSRQPLWEGPEWVETPQLPPPPAKSSQCQQRKESIDLDPGPSKTQRNRVGVQIYSLDTSQGTSFDCWVFASGRIFWILLSTTGEIHWGLKKINQRWESSDLLNLSFITLKIRIASHLAIRHWDAKSLVKFLSFQAVESALPMWCLICSGHGILTFAEQLNKQIRLPHNRLQWGQTVLSAILKYGLQQSIFFDDSDSWCC